MASGGRIKRTNGKVKKATENERERERKKERERQKLIAFSLHPDETFFIMQRGQSS